MRSGVAGQIALMHSNTSSDSHKEGHRRAFENRARRFGILTYVDVLLNNVTRRINVIPVEVGGMIMVLLHNLIVANWGIMAFASGGDLGNADQLIRFVEVRALLLEVNDDGGRAGNSVPIPIRNRINPSLRITAIS